MKKFVTLAVIATLLFSSVTVNAAEPTVSAKQNADYMMQKGADGVPNWFNGSFYSDKYADLKKVFGSNEKSLYNHSLICGFNEARLVSPVLDVVKYRAFYPDLDKAFGDNWKLYIKHYYEYGIAEGRKNFTDFDAKTYLSIYPDLQKAFGDDLGLATRHYIEFGYAEGRIYAYPEMEDVEEDSSSEENEVGIVFPDGSYEEIIRDEEGNVVKRILYASDGTMLSYVLYERNESERSETTTTYLPDNTIMHKNTRYYDENGYLIEFIDYEGDGHIKIHELYENDANGNRTKMEVYDENGSLLQKTEYQYDEQERLIWERTYYMFEGSLDSYTDCNFNENGQIVSRKSYTADGIIFDRYDYTYDANGLNTQETQYWYNVDGSVNYYRIYEILDNGETELRISYVDYDAGNNKLGTGEYDYNTEGLLMELRFYDADDYLEGKDIYQDGYLYTRYWYYKPSGNISDMNVYRADGTVSVENSYYENGNLRREGIWENGQKISDKYYKEDGTFDYEKPYEEG